MSLTSLEPESSASANSAISANHEYYYSIEIRICQHLFSIFLKKNYFFFDFLFFASGLRFGRLRTLYPKLPTFLPGAKYSPCI